MKKYKSMIIGVAVLVCLIAVYFISGAVKKKQEEAAGEPAIMVTNIYDVTEMTYTDGSTTLSFVKENEVWYDATDKDFALDSVQVETIADSLRQIEATRLLEGADEPAAYGLDEPVYTITLKNQDAVVTTVYIGDTTDAGYYVTTDDKTTIYTVSSSVVSAMEFDKSALEVVEEETEAEETEVEE